jgi:hypothetical protein
MRELFVSLVLASLVATMMGIPVAASQSTTPPNLEKVTFVHYAQSTGHSKPVWDDTVEDFKLIAGGVKWSGTISYEVNPTGSGLDEAVVRSTLETSSETWDSATSFELFALPTITSGTSIGLDGTNRIVWSALSPGIIAVTYLWYNPATKQIVEFDMVFNTYYAWSTSGTSSAMDLRNIATHEFGHNGLGDLRSPKDQALTMYAYSGLEETIKQTLGTGDILGIQKLYGAP